MSDSVATFPTAKPSRSLADAPTTSRRNLPWSALGKAAVAALGAIATALHFIGQEAYDRYLGHWGFDSGLLPLDTSIRVHYGYRAVLEGLHTLLNSPAGGAFLAAIFFMCAIQFWVTSATRNYPPESTRLGRWLKRNADRLPRWLKSLVSSFGLSGLIVGLLYYLVLAAFIALAVAPIIGEHAADKWAKHKEGQIQLGCQRSGKRGVCTELSDEGKVVGRGFIISGSTTYNRLL